MIIDPAIISTVRAKIDEQMGPIPSGVDPAPIDQQRQRLAISIAEAGLYVRDNAVVPPGITVTTNTGSGQTTGPGKLS